MPSLTSLRRATPTAVLVAALAREVSGGRFSVPLRRQRVPVLGEGMMVSHKSVYFGTVSVGQPSPQEFSVVFDTGSAHVILPSSQCLSDSCRIHRRYDPEGSAVSIDVEHDGTRVLPGQPRDQVTVAFGTGEVTGVFVQDRLCLREGAASEGGGLEPESEPEAAPRADGEKRQGWAPSALLQTRTKVRRAAGASADPRCVDMRIITATEMSHEPFYTLSFDGVLGLSLGSLALAPEFSVLDVLSGRGQLEHPSFGVFLADGDEEVSEITFGGHDPDKMQGEPVWAPVVEPELGHWQVQITAVRLGDQTLDWCADGLCRAVVDTGTSLLAVPAAFADDLSTALEDNLRDPPEPGPGVEAADCREATGLPLHFDLEGFTVTLEPRDYTRQALRMRDDGSTVPVRLPARATDNGSKPLSRGCWPTLMPIDFPAPLGPKLFIWGEPVLRKYYSVYDARQERIGFGLAARAGAAAEPRRGAGGAAATAGGGAAPASRRVRQPLLF